MTTTCPISPHTAADILQPYPIDFSTDKLKRLVGWTPTHRLTAAVVRETVEGFRKEGNWPNATPKYVFYRHFFGAFRGTSS